MIAKFRYKLNGPSNSESAIPIAWGDRGLRWLGGGGGGGRSRFVRVELGAFVVILIEDIIQAPTIAEAKSASDLEAVMFGKLAVNLSKVIGPSQLVVGVRVGWVLGDVVRITV